jgi:hypothetical protein
VTVTTGALSWIHWLALSLVAVTGVIHVYLFTTESWLPFLMAGLGFLGALGLFFVVESYRRVLYVGIALFTIGQIVGYLLLPIGPVWLAALDKAVQVALVVALAYLFVADGRQTASSEPEA